MATIAIGPARCPCARPVWTVELSLDAAPAGPSLVIGTGRCRHDALLDALTRLADAMDCLTHTYRASHRADPAGPDHHA